MSMRKSSGASQTSYDNTASLGIIPVKPEVPAFNHDEHEASEYVEVEEEPGTEPTEEWEKDIPPFLRKLSTMNDGSLIVKDPDYLSSYLLPTYFQAIKACSFVRQLNMYGFHKIDDPTGQNPKHYEFRHPSFVPGHRELLKKIERRKTSKRNTSKNEEEPPRSKATGAGAAAAAAKLPVPAPDPTAALANQSILEAVTKLQKQTQDNQQALLQVLGELKSYRQSHNDLEHKLNQYISQNNAPPQQQQAYNNAPNYAAKPAPNRPIVNVRRNPNPNPNQHPNGNPNGNPNGAPRLITAGPNGAPNGHPNGNYANPPVQQQRSGPPPNGVARPPVRQQANYPPQRYQQQQQQDFATGMAVYASAPQEPIHPLDHSGQYIQQYDDGQQYSNQQDGYDNYSVQVGYTPTRHSGSYAPPPIDEHSLPNTPANNSPYQQNVDYHSPSAYSSSSPYTPAHSSNESTPSPPAAYTGEYHSPENHNNGSNNNHSADGTDPSSIPPQYYNTINFNENHASEQLDEFVLLNLGLEDQGHFSEYMNNELLNNGTSHSTDSYVNNGHHPAALLVASKQQDQQQQYQPSN